MGDEFAAVDQELANLFDKALSDADEIHNNLVPAKSAFELIKLLSNKYQKIQKVLCIKSKIHIFGMQIDPVNNLVYIDASDDVKNACTVKEHKNYEGIHQLPRQIKSRFYGADAVEMCNLTVDLTYIVSLSPVFDIEHQTKIHRCATEVLSNLQRIIYHEKKMLMHFCTGTSFANHLIDAHDDFEKSIRTNLPGSFIEGSDSENDDDSMDSTQYQYDVVPFDAVCEVQRHFPYILKQPIKINPFNKGMEILLNALSLHNLRKEGSELRQQKKIYPYSLLQDKNGELVCQQCGSAESHHPIFDVEARKDHAFYPEVCTYVGAVKSVNTHAWVAIEKDSILGQKIPSSDIASFVNYIINSSHPLYSLLARMKDSLIKELINCTNEARFPSVKRRNSDDKYGPINAFQNGIFICMECKFFTYDEFEGLKQMGAYKDAISHYSEDWFFIERYQKQIQGKPCCESVNRPSQFKFQNYVPNICCAKCGTHKFQHKSVCKNPDFSVLKCTTCNGHCKVDGRAPDGVVPFENEMFKGCICSKQGAQPQCYVIDVPKGIFDVDSPFIDSVFNEQFEEHNDYKAYLGIYFWVFVLGGFFILPLNKKTSWEVIPAIFGEAGSGKSLFLQALCSLVPPNNVGNLSSNAQETFGLEALIDESGHMKKYAIFETSGAFKICSQQFQSMSSQEHVTINRKNKTVFTTERWNQPGFMIGNLKPSWSDVGGALRRRFIQFIFKKKVKITDGKLKKRIRLPALLYKCCIAYKFASTYFGACSLLDKNRFSYRDPNHHGGDCILPPSLIKWNKALLNEMSPLTYLLSNPEIMKLDRIDAPMFIDRRADVSPNQRIYVRLEDVKEAYNHYIRNSKWKRSINVNFEPDLYESIFKSFGLDCKKCKLRWPPKQGQYVENTYVFNLGQRLMFQEVYDENQNLNAESQERVISSTDPVDLILGLFDDFQNSTRNMDTTNFENQMKIFYEKLNAFKLDMISKVKDLQRQADNNNIDADKIEKGVNKMCSTDNNKVQHLLIDLLEEAIDKRKSTIGKNLTEKMKNLYTSFQNCNDTYANSNELDDSDMELSDSEIM